MKLSAMAEPKPEAASNAAKEQEETTRKEMTKTKGLASLVKVEGVCTECEFSLVFHMPKDWVQRWLNYGGGSPVSEKCGPGGGGSLAPGRTLHAYHNGEPCDLPDHWKV